MTRATLILTSQSQKQRAISWIDKAPVNTRLTFNSPKRTLDQNDKMWAMLTDVAEQCLHHGLKLKPDDWKNLFLDALERELRMVPNLSGDGFVALNRSSSNLSKGEMSDMIELLYAYGAKHGVIWGDEAGSNDIAGKGKGRDAQAGLSDTEGKGADSAGPEG